MTPKQNKIMDKINWKCRRKWFERRTFATGDKLVSLCGQGAGQLEIKEEKETAKLKDKRMR